MLAAVRAIAAAVAVPVSADLEAGYAQDPGGVVARELLGAPGTYGSGAGLSHADLNTIMKG